MLDEGVCAGSLGQVDGGARRTAERDHAFQFGQLIAFGIPGGEDNVSDVLLNLFVDVYFVDNGTSLEYLLRSCLLYTSPSPRDS